MPFIPHTPESLLRRNDSRNPATTCRGITVQGKHCRRRVLATVCGVRGVRGPDSYCWQHQDQVQVQKRAGTEKGQAEVILEHEGAPQTPASTQREDSDIRRTIGAPGAAGGRSSLDTLVERLRLVNLSREGSNRRHRLGSRRPHITAIRCQDNEKSDSRRPALWQSHVRSNLGLFCCIRAVDDEEEAAPRPRPPVHNTSRRPHVKSSPRLPDRVLSEPVVTFGPIVDDQQPLRARLPPSLLPGSPATHSKTQTLQTLIPNTLPRPVSFALLAELARPFPNDDTASSLISEMLTPSINRPDQLTEARSDSLERYASKRGISRGVQSAVAPVLVKIGRAANVQRRMNQWTRQCGYNLSLIRWYPYTASSSSLSETRGSPQKVPRIQRVERLIHLELAHRRVMRQCDTCGKQHREWFEVDGSQAGLRAVDQVIRRWVAWAQQNHEL